MTRRIELTAETWPALDNLQHETGRPLHDLAEEAFSDLIAISSRSAVSPSR